MSGEMNIENLNANAVYMAQEVNKADENAGNDNPEFTAQLASVFDDIIQNGEGDFKEDLIEGIERLNGSESQEIYEYLNGNNQARRDFTNFDDITNPLVGTITTMTNQIDQNGDFNLDTGEVAEVSFPFAEQAKNHLETKYAAYDAALDNTGTIKKKDDESAIEQTVNDTQGTITLVNDTQVALEEKANDYTLSDEAQKEIDALRNDAKVAAQEAQDAQAKADEQEAKIEELKQGLGSSLPTDLINEITNLSNSDDPENIKNPKGVNPIKIDGDVNNSYSSIILNKYGVAMRKNDGSGEVSDEYKMFEQILQDTVIKQNEKYGAGEGNKNLIFGLEYTMPDIKTEELEDGRTVCIAGDTCYIQDKDGNISKYSKSELEQAQAKAEKIKNAEAELTALKKDVEDKISKAENLKSSADNREEQLKQEAEIKAQADKAKAEAEAHEKEQAKLEQESVEANFTEAERIKSEIAQNKQDDSKVPTTGGGYDEQAKAEAEKTYADAKTAEERKNAMKEAEAAAETLGISEHDRIATAANASMQAEANDKQPKENEKPVPTTGGGDKAVSNTKAPINNSIDEQKLNEAQRSFYNQLKQAYEEGKIDEQTYSDVMKLIENPYNFNESAFKNNIRNYDAVVKLLSDPTYSLNTNPIERNFFK